MRACLLKKTPKAPNPFVDMNVADVGHKEGFAWKKAEQKWAPIPAPGTMPQTGAEQELQSAPWACLEMGQQN